MKKLNVFNKVLLVMAVVLTVATVVRYLSYHSSPRYYYGASVSYPNTFPVKVWTSELLLEGNEKKQIQTKSVSDEYGTWGFGDSPTISHEERLPVAVVISYASLRDKAFYRDTIPLPHDRIRSLFKTLETRGLKTSIYGAPQELKRFDLVLGLANKGNVVVWIQGDQFEQVLLKRRLNAYVPRKGDDFYQPGGVKKNYFETAFHSDSLRTAEAGGFKDEHANYIDTPSRYLRGY